MTLLHLLKGVAVFVCLLSSFAAAVDGSFAGTVTDPIGAVVANVPVSITDIKTGKKIELKAGPAGNFGPISLSGGKYKVRISSPCFRRYSRVVKIEPGQSSELKIALQGNRGCME